MGDSGGADNGNGDTTDGVDGGGGCWGDVTDGGCGDVDDGDGVGGGRGDGGGRCHHYAASIDELFISLLPPAPPVLLII